MVLLPEGKIINHPDTVKLIKVLPTTLQNETFFVVIIKLDDDTELMLDRCALRIEAEALADRCCRLLNGEELDSTEIPSFVKSEVQKEVTLEESSDWDLSDEEEAESSEDTKLVSAEEESSDWDLSESDVADDSESSKEQMSVVEESSSWDLSESETDSKDKTSSPAEEESSDWDFSSEAEKQESIEESSSWGASSEDVEVPQSKETSKPTIKMPYAEPKTKATTNSKPQKVAKAVVESKVESPQFPDVVNEQPPTQSIQPKTVPRVVGFIEDDSDEWIPDNGFDDWYD